MNEIKPTQKPWQPVWCYMAGCKGRARAGLPGLARLFCSEDCYKYAQMLDPEHFPGENPAPRYSHREDNHQRMLELKAKAWRAPE